MAGADRADSLVSRSRSLGRVGIVSPEPWDEIRRRNQYLVRSLLALGLADSILWLDPPSHSLRRAWTAQTGVTVAKPVSVVPKRLGGHAVVALQQWWRRLSRVDVVWINDPNLGRYLPRRPPAFYDVTDDWRESEMTDRERRRLVSAEDRLATTVPTVVCSDVLRSRWHERYGFEPPVVQNAADVGAIRAARPFALPGEGPHVGYVGTLHDVRLDVSLVCRMADRLGSGTVHLVGPNHLSAGAHRQLENHPRIRLQGPVPFTEVPSWLASFDVLTCPHLVSDFTLSLDAIKAHEYLATPLPVVATPSSGFQNLRADGLVIAGRDFPDAVAHAAETTARYDRAVPTWDDRAREFAAAVGDALGLRPKG